MSRIHLAVSNNTVRNNSFYFDRVEDVLTYRVTGLEIAEKCGHSWHRNFLRKYRDANDIGNRFSQAGTIYHLLIENHIRTTFLREQFLGLDEIGEALAKLDELDFKHEYPKLLKYLGRLNKVLMGAEIIGVEKDFEIWPYPIINGQVDLLFIKNGEYYIGDHKSHREPVRKSTWFTKLQMCLYTYAVCNEYKLDHVNWFVGQTNQKEDATFVMYHNPQVTRQRIELALSNVKNNVYNVGGHCKYCPGKNECEEHEENRKMVEELLEGL